ncbi:MAG TPA: crosslink repair DNA glycosylase YcaQ family protein [Trebonia sp.]|nr:crosslink repair DNA glycosylase YcaQ family protein [Trebonia sp.]
MHQLSRREARRVAVRAQLLAGQRPRDLLSVVRRLTFLQLDPVSAIALSADLVAWTRLGKAYHRDDLKAAIASQTIIELRAFLRPAEDFALYRADMAAWPGSGELRDWQVFIRGWVAANDKCRREILARLAAAGPLQSRELPDLCEKPWESTGWTNNKNVTRLLEFMVSRGEVAVAGRKGRERLWDLAERVYPGHPLVPAEQAGPERDRRRLAALGIARPAGPEAAIGMEPAVVGQAGEPATVEGTKGTWRVDPAYLDGSGFEGRAALLSPFDRLVHDRVRAQEIFGFDYQLEMYKPAAKRRWGYYALPVLYGDQLAGKLDATADRKAGVLRVNAVHEDIPFTKEMAAAIDAEIAGLAAWLELDLQNDLRLLVLPRLYRFPRRTEHAHHRSG